MAKQNENPDEIVHLQVKPGQTVIYRDHAYGDRATIQVPRREAGAFKGATEEVDGNAVPDVSERPAAA